MASNFILTVLNGIDPGREYLIEPLPDLRLTVGRAQECNIWIDDSTVSRRHLEIFVDGEGLRIRDLGSSNGTFIGDARIEESALAAGDPIRAGEIELALRDAVAASLPYEPREVPAPPGDPVMAPVLSPAHRDGPQPPTVFRACRPIDPIAVLTQVAPVAVLQQSAAPEPDTRLARLAGTLDSGKHLYALVDGAVNFELVVMGRLMGHAVYTLFDGAEIAELASTGPALVSIGAPESYLAAWDGHLGSAAGVLLESAEGHEYVHAHLRRIFLVADQQDQEYVLPYFDPPTFLATVRSLSPAQLHAFFGPVARWFCEDGEDYLSLTLAEGGLQADPV